MINHNKNTMKIEHYDKVNDIMGIHFGKETKESAELFDGKLVIDFDKDDNIVGIEIFDYLKELKKGQDKIKHLFGKEVRR